MAEIEIPEYFICPISLQIMKDPVTAITGITYDRESIEKWLTTTNPTCPVTKQPLPPDSDLTPNHTLRRLIQSWCMLNAKHGVDRIPTPKSPFGRSHVLKLIRDLNDPALSESALKKMGNLAGESERNRKCIESYGAVDAVVKFLVRRYRDDGRVEINGVPEALTVLRLIPVSPSRNRDYDYEELIGFLKRIVADDTVDDEMIKSNALRVLKMVLQVSEKKVLEKLLDPDFLEAILSIIKQTRASKQLIKLALEVLQETCPYGMNREKLLEANVIFDLIELGLDHSSDHKQITELVFDLLARLCVFADGRRQFLSHAGAVPMTAKRIMRVSAVTDERAVQILSVIARFSATKEVMREMVRVGAVAKLCMVVQADCGGQVKEEAKRILRMHSNVWSNSPCIEVYLFTRYPN